MLKFFYTLILIIILVAVGLFFLGSKKEKIIVKDFDSCVRAGNAVLESYPEQCKDENGKTYSRDIGNELEKKDLIRVSYPRPGNTIESPVTIKGEARGYWFFEASFPVYILDWGGTPIARGVAEAKGEWMTEDFVPFEVTLTFLTPTRSDRGTLILKKDNPSGLKEHDDLLRIPVIFKTK
jgi:hypothetical protein